MLGVKVKRLRLVLISVSLVTCMTASTIPSAMAIGKGDRRWKNEFKMYTVKCQVHKFGAGNAVLGYVVGNEAKAEDAENVADRFVSKFGAHGSVAKRHCHTQKRYIPNGAYDQDMNQI